MLPEMAQLTLAAKMQKCNLLADFRVARVQLGLRILHCSRSPLCAPIPLVRLPKKRRFTVEP